MMTKSRKRVAKMVSQDTAARIRELAELIRSERNQDRRMSDNDVIKLSLLEAVERRQQ